MNLLQITEELKGVSRSFLEKEANPATSSGQYPGYAVVAELSKRVNEEQRFAAAEAQMPTQTVAEQTMAKAAASMPTSATMAMGQMQPDMNTGLRSVGAGGGMVNMLPNEPMGQETMGMPAVIRMYEGGRINMKEGALAGDALVNRINQLRTQIANARTPMLKNTLIGQLQRLQSQLDTQGDTSGDIISGVTPIGTVSGDTDAQAEAAAEVDRKEAALAQKDKFLTIADENPDVQKTGESVSTPGELRNWEQTRKELAEAIDAQQQAQNNFDNDPTAENQEKLDNATAQVTNAERITKIRAEATPEEATTGDATDKTTNKDEDLEGYSIETEDETRERLQNNPEFMAGTKRTLAELKDKESNIKDFSSGITVPEPITIENTLKDIRNNRSNKAIEKVYARLDKEEDSIEKDRRLAIPKTIMQFGLALATANDGSFLRAVASAGKQASATYSALQNDLRKSDKLLDQARSDLDLAQAARDDGDIKEARRIVERRTDRIAAAEEAKANAAYRVNTLLQKNDELLLTVQTSLETGLDKAVESEVTTQRADRLALATAKLTTDFNTNKERRDWISGNLDKIRTAIGSLTKGTTDPYGMGSGQLTEEAKKQLNRLRADRELYETLQSQYFPEIATAPAQ
jgi:hypothetical protein